MPRVELIMMTAKMGRVRIHRKELEIGGSARSARRSINGPEPGRGAATTVRRGVAWFLKRWRRVLGRIRDLEIIFLVLRSFRRSGEGMIVAQMHVVKIGALEMFQMEPAKGRPDLPVH